MIINIAEQRASFNDVYVIDFGDDYHQTIKPATELEGLARKIRRRYRRIKEFLVAQEVYHKYMETIYSQFPNKQLAKMQIAAGNVNVFIPPKPRMKNNNEKKFFDKGIIFNSSEPVIDFEALELQVQNKMETDETSLIPLTIKSDLGDVKDMDDVVEGIGKDGKVIPGYRRGSKKRSMKGGSDYELLMSFYNNRNSAVSGGTEGDEYTPDKPYSFTDQIMIDSKFEQLTGDYEDPNEVVKHKGRYLKAHRVKEMEMFDDLGSKGWNSLKLMNNLGASKKITAIAAKEAKSIKKHKKYMKKNEKQFFGVAGDRSESQYTFNGFDQLEEEMTNMSTGDLFNIVNRGN